jgi:hypothetical protein
MTSTSPTRCRHDLWLLALAAGLLGMSGSLGAQSPRTTRANNHAWFVLNGEAQVAPRWHVDYDLSIRRHGPVEAWQQFLPRAALRYDLRPGVRVSWGYAFVETWPYGVFPVTYRFPEHRMWQQLQLAHATGRVAVTHRYRLEQRWLGRVAEADGREEVEAWVRSNRARYRLQGVIPLQGATLDDNEFYASIGDELFVNWGANIQGNVFDQNRIVLALGRRFTSSFRLEAGYLEQLLMRPNGTQVERNRTLMVAGYVVH